MITTNDADLARKLRCLRNHGQDGGPRFVMAGGNYRLTEIQGALGVSQMKKLDRIVSGRREAAARYDALLPEIGMRGPVVASGSLPVYQTYAPLVPVGVSRDEVVARLRAAGVEANIGTYHLALTEHQRKRGYTRGDFPVADDVADRNISLPLYAGISADDQLRVVKALGEALAS